MNNVTIETSDAPAAVGAYSQGKIAGNMIFTSGQLGLEPESGKLAGAEVEVEARRALENVIAVVKAGGGDVETIVKTTVYLVDLDDYEVINSVYKSFFGDALPARAVIEVAGLPRGMRLEIEAIALVR